MHLLGAGFSRGTTNQPMEVEVSEGGARRVGSEGRMSRRPPSISARCLWVPAWLVILWVDGRPDPPPCASNSRPACCASQLLIPSPSVSPCLTYGAVNTCMSLDIDHRAFPAAKGAWAAWGWWLGSIRHWRAGESPCAGCTSDEVQATHQRHKASALRRRGKTWANDRQVPIYGLVTGEREMAPPQQTRDGGALLMREVPC